MIRLSVEVEDGSILPRGYGVAWHLWEKDACVAMPIPINLFAGMARGWWFWLKRGFFRSSYGPRYASAMESARRQGFRMGYINGWSDHASFPNEPLIIPLDSV